MLPFWTFSNPLGAILLASAAMAFASMLFSSRTGLKGRHASLASRVMSLFSKPWIIIRYRTKAWAFLFSGRKIMHDGYKQSQGAPFYVDVPENRYWVISSQDQIKEMNAAPQSVLSLLGAAYDLLQPKYTMREFNWMDDRRATEGVTLIKTLRNDLTNHLPEVLPEIRMSLSALLDQHYESLPSVNGARVSSIFPVISRAIAQSNAFVFFGKELSHNTEFIKAGITMVEHTLIISNVVQILPKSISDTVAKFLSSRLNAGDIVYDTLVSMVAQRFEERDRARLGHEVPKHTDCVQWIMDNSPKTKPWTVGRVVHELVALWYGSVHITSVSACFVLFDLCNNKEYADPLRKEIENTGWEAFDKSGGRLLPLMDSFIKESTRLNPVECMSTRRRALKPFHFADGTKVEAGQWVCTPLAGMGLDPKNYACPDEFHGFRFVQPATLAKSLAEIPRHDFQIPEGQKPSQFTDMSDLPFWGAGKLTCGGRLYASAAIKMLLGLFLTKWDLQLAQPDAKQHFTWRGWIYPSANMKGILRPINKEQLLEGH
ncbi:putative cytochrome P450 [Biscogniauxia sp. FL1348]|nr:putative cytochrome P450 [Biscogniauxia sp. FL1348]